MASSGDEAQLAKPQRATDPRSLFEEFLPRYLGEQGGEGLPEDVVVVFHIHGDGGGSWRVRRNGLGLHVGPLTPGHESCVVRCGSAVLMDIVHGKVGSREAFLRGDLRVVGDVGLVLRLESALRAAA